MANTTISPDMNLPIPVVGEDPGPDWANNINACLNAIDSHNHSSGQGVQINPAGLNINSDLTMGSNNLTNIRSSRYTAQTAPLSAGADVDCVYVSGVDLWYNDGNGNQVRLTAGGNPAGGAGSITGLPSGTASVSFSAATYTFQSATNTLATMNVGPLNIGTTAVNSFKVTVQPNSAIAANYNLTLPAALPASTSFVSVTSAGQLVFSPTSIAYNPAASGGTSGIVSGTQGLKGFTDASSVTAGYLGEEIIQKLTSFRNVEGVTGAWADSVFDDTTSTFILTAGTWDISINMYWQANGATIAQIECGVSTTSGNSSTGLTLGDNVGSAVGNTTNDSGVQLTPYRVNISGSTTYYLKQRLLYTAGIPRYQCKIRAIRVR